MAITSALFAALTLAAAAGSPPVNIASGPLFNGRGNVHPNILLSLSVEFPTVGIAYRGDNGTYNRTVEYPGYFNPLKCYEYNGGNRNLADTGNPDADGYFKILKDADAATHECGGDSFSGNFMNWVSSSSIDMLRYAATGGDRVYDKPGVTILQRAVLRDGDADNFYAHDIYFPRRTVTAGGNVSAPKQVTPFGVKTLYIVSCRNRILFSDVNSGMKGNVDSKAASAYCTSVFDEKNKDRPETKDKRLGEYLVRVKVCDSINEGAERKDLCKKYVGGYKPVGDIQRNAERMRLAVMGYLLDDSETRYGGVLRAPMKYVGAKKREAPDFVEIENDRPEWDPETGVFYNNPEDPANRDGTPNSGVINYLNKFGRGGSYKRYDPLSELYYEGIRYLQGKAPTAEATKGMTVAMKDGFPVITDWSDPVIASCQKNYIVTIADVNTHWDRYVPGNQRTTFNGTENAYDAARDADAIVAGKTPAFDVKIWTQKVGQLENNAANPSKNTALTDLQTRDTGAGGHGTYYMAGLAYWANTNDIRLDKPVRVKTFAIDVDEGGNGLIDGNSRGGAKPRDSQLYLAAKYGGFEDRNGDGNPYITIPEGGTAEVRGTNTEWDTNGNGIPPNYFLAGQPKEIIEGIRKIFARIGSISGTISGVSVSTNKISSGDAYVYQPGFNSATWSGNLRKLPILLENDIVKIGISPQWDAGEILTGTRKPDGTVAVAPRPAPKDRKIYTAKFDDRKLLSTVEFKWEALTEAQKALLDASPADGANDGLGQKRIDYLRGDRSFETGKGAGTFRARERVLGDIINGNPVYVGAPAANVQGDGYQAFREKYSGDEAGKGRAAAVYVGANDGMLHAFDAGDGTELFSYVPNALIKDLNRLTSQEYVHQPYVDGMLTVTEAKVNGSWKTVLASGMGGGAQGVFALDVTDPANFNGGSGALFEFTDADDKDIGNLTGTPLIAKFRAKGAGGAMEYKYFVVVPSGLNNYSDDGSGRFSTTGEGALFLLSLDKAPAAAWQEGGNYFKFKVPNVDTALQNGLSTPALVVDVDGAVRYAYAGDLQGNLWRFDFTADSPSSAAGAGSRPLYVAKDARGARQPITMQPKVVFAPGGGYVALFGTGKFVEDNDAAPGYFKPQSFYGIYDIIRDAAGNAVSVTGRDQLASRKLEKDGGSALRISGDAFSYGVGSGQKKGWYFDFLDADRTGERSVTNSLLADGKLYFNSLIPGGDPCVGGGGRMYVLNALTGLPSNGGVTGALSTVGMLSPPARLEFGVRVGDRNAIGRRSVTKKESVVSFGTDDAISSETSESSVPAGRFSWREILNWEELRNVVRAKK